MKKLFSLLAVAVLGFTACQTDEGVKNATLDNEGVVNLNVSVPELATRALDGDDQSGADSAYGAIDYANYTAFLQEEYDVRFQLAVYEVGAAEDAEPIYTAVQTVDKYPFTNFNDLRFVPGREYQFVLFADFVKQGTTEDFRYNTADLRNITSFEPLNAMDETYDAYFFNKTFKIESGQVNYLDATLKRPFGKIRVLTTDLAFVENYAMPAAGEVTFYNHAIYKSFNAVTGQVATEATNAEETLRYAIDTDYYGATQYNNAPACTLFATYILGKDAQEAVNFRLDTFEEDGSLIKSLDFNTEIPYQRNHLTTLVGNLLTNEADLYVHIDDNFDAKNFQGGDFENPETGLEWVRQGESVGGSQVYAYETNLFTFWLLSESDGTVLRAGKYDYTEELPYIQNATGFQIKGLDVEKGTLTVTDRGTRAENYYDVVFDIYATIDGKTENYILTWNGALKAARTELAVPEVTYEIDEVEYLDITFSWKAVDNAANYTVKWNDEELTVEGTSATFDFSDEKDVYATASVTANPANADDYIASTGYVTVDWKKPIEYQTIAIELAGIDDVDGAHFYSIMKGLDLTISVPNYPELKDAWYQVPGQIPTPFSAEAKAEVTVGSAAGYVIYEPNADLDKETDGPEAYAFTYVGSMEPYVLTKYELNWLAGYNTVKVKFSNEAGDAIEFQTSAPMAAGHATIEPSYVKVDNGEVPVSEIDNAEINVLLDEDGEYTVFFKIESATNDILMQYVGAIDFEKPAPEYTADYVFTTATAGFDTITFTNEKGQEFVIEATELVEGKVVAKELHIDNDINFDNGDRLSVVAESVTEEGGIYDARYVVTVGNSSLKLQFKGKLTPYTPEIENVPLNNANYQYLGVYKGHKITVEGYSFEIIIGELTNKQYSQYGDQNDHYFIGETKYFFTDGDSLAYDAEKEEVTVTFVADLGAGAGTKRYIVTASTKVEKWDNVTETATLQKMANGNMAYVSKSYMLRDGQWWYIDFEEGGKYETEVTATGYIFTFKDEKNKLNVTIEYKDPNYTEPVDVTLTLEGEIYKGIYETTIYSLTGLDYGKAMLQIDYADGSSAKQLTADYTEDEQFITFTFIDTVNKVKVTARYQKTNGPVVNANVVNFTTISEPADFASYYKKFDLADDNGNKVSLVVDAYTVSGNNINAGEYTWISSPTLINANNFSFVNKSLVIDGAKYANTDISGKMVVANDGKITMDVVVAEVEYTLIYTPSAVTPGPGTDDDETEWSNVTYDAVAAGVSATGFAQYTADIYTVAGTQWSAPGTDGGEANYTVVDGLHTWTFDDETNKRHVTITYKEAGSQPEGPVTYDPWAFESSYTGSFFAGYTVTLTGTGENKDVIIVAGVRNGDTLNAKNLTFTRNGNAVSATGEFLMTDEGKFVFNFTIGDVTYIAK